MASPRISRCRFPVPLHEQKNRPDPARPELDAYGQAVSGRLAHLLDLDEEIVAAEDVGVTRRGAQVDAVGNAADAGKLGDDLLHHELAAEAGLRTLGDVDLEPVRAVHVVDVPAEPPAEHLEDELARGASLRVAHPALAGVLGDADRALGRCAERPVAHRRDHHRHRELERVEKMLQHLADLDSLATEEIRSEDTSGGWRVHSAA